MKKNWSNSFIATLQENHMGLFSRKKEMITVGTICPKCKMQFTEPGRMLRHMQKAHKKKRKIECNSCGFRN